MLPAVPDRRRSPSRSGAGEPGLATLAATTTASAAVLGVAVGVGEHSVILGVVFAAVGAGVRLAIASFQRIRKLPVDPIDPYALPDPWRGVVREALDAGKRFHLAVEAWPPGPLRERLVSLGTSVDGEVRLIWGAAQQGAVLSGGYPPGVKHPSLDDLTAELDALRRDKSEVPETDRARRDDLDQAEAALVARVEAARRARSTSDAVFNRLQSLVARLNEAVVSVVALTAGPGGAGDVEGAIGSIEGISEELASLQAGLGEAAELTASGGTAPSPPPTP